MSLKALRQYLEMLRYSGIKNIYHPLASQELEPAVDKQSLLAELQNKYATCTKCPLHTNRINLVYGEGNPHAKMMLIGEAPGDQENKTGRPFVGDAGNLLNKMLAAIEIRREDIYIANIVKCRPPGNRNPLAEEKLACLPYLVEQISIIQPQVLLLMGLVAAQTLLENTNTLAWHRGKQHGFMGISAYVTYHPAALLRNPDWKRGAWEDLQAFQKVYSNLA